MCRDIHPSQWFNCSFGGGEHAVRAVLAAIPSGTPGTVVKPPPPELRLVRSPRLADADRFPPN
jgi:hypothetical protein